MPAVKLEARSPARLRLTSPTDRARRRGSASRQMALLQARTLGGELTDRSERIRIAQWIEKLSIEWASYNSDGIVNSYIDELLAVLRSGEFKEPFDKRPPAGRLPHLLGRSPLQGSPPRRLGSPRRALATSPGHKKGTGRVPGRCPRRSNVATDEQEQLDAWRHNTARRKPQLKTGAHVQYPPTRSKSNGSAGRVKSKGSGGNSSTKANRAKSAGRTPKASPRRSGSSGRRRSQSRSSRLVSPGRGSGGGGSRAGEHPLYSAGGYTNRPHPRDVPYTESAARFSSQAIRRAVARDVRAWSPEHQAALAHQHAVHGVSPNRVSEMLFQQRYQDYARAHAGSGGQGRTGQKGPKGRTRPTGAFPYNP